MQQPRNDKEANRCTVVIPRCLMSVSSYLLSAEGCPCYECPVHLFAHAVAVRCSCQSLEIDMHHILSQPNIVHFLIFFTGDE